ncbi:MAG: VapC toxin family PIN domain ribonuclease [Thermoanaerobaculia bacterium]|nr:VapC toxin family PIN domain ribonuclease [Thermoanaerobaculia bacterium]
MRALLDVNVLLALLDADHVEHRLAREWFTREVTAGWASCALTQNGLVRVLSQSGYPSPVTTAEAMNRLRRATSSQYHEFWGCELSLLDPTCVREDRLLGPRQVTDVYLLALAVQRAGRFVTFDRSVPLGAVPAATTENLVVL